MIPEIRLLAAKTSRENDNLWLPLLDHLKDTAGVIEYLSSRWLPGSVYDELEISRKEGIRLAKLLALLHDIGKGIPAFQTRILEQLPDIRCFQESAGIETNLNRTQMDIKHAHAGAVLLRAMGYPESVAAIVGAHHGSPEPNNMDDDAFDELTLERKKYGDKNSIWRKMQEELLKWALEEAGYSEKGEIPDISEAAQMIFCGLLIMADWIASNSYYFPLLSVTDDTEPYDNNRSRDAMRYLNLPDGCLMGSAWKQEDFFEERFHFTANRVQKEMYGVAARMEKPGLIILEAPMGEGKTEAALAAAEILMNRFDLKGIAFFLPSQATTNAMFTRISSWLTGQSDINQVSIQLYHSNAELNEDFRKLEYGDVCIEDDDQDALIVHSFFRGKKTRMLSDIVVGTIDQLLMAALMQKHVMLRHLGLAGKVAVIDECHSFDPYMNTYLESILQWLGIYHIPVILLSATLPGDKRLALMQAYAGKKKCKNALIKETTSYPLISWSDHERVQLIPIPYDKKDKVVQIVRENEEQLEEEVRNVLKHGGCMGIILNTVSRVQKIAKFIQDKFPEAKVLIDHSQFILPDRLEHEKEILNCVGKHSANEQRRDVVVVGSQVLEQSLDLDFDVLITDLCPMDLLLQRIGRLHRHERKRPEMLKSARCVVWNSELDNLEKGATAVYGEYLLLQTSALLPEKIMIPSDICSLVQKTYCEIDENQRFQPAYEEYKKECMLRKQNAKPYCLEKPEIGKYGGTLVGLLDKSVGLDDVKAQAAVRDGNPSIEVIVVRETEAGFVSIIAGKLKGKKYNLREAISIDEAREISEQKLRLPQRLAQPWCAERVVKQLRIDMEQHTKEWQNNPMLEGELILFLDATNHVSLDEIRLFYDEKKGLEWEVEKRG